MAVPLSSATRDMTTMRHRRRVVGGDVDGVEEGFDGGGDGGVASCRGRAVRRRGDSDPDVDGPGSTSMLGPVPDDARKAERGTSEPGESIVPKKNKKK